MAESTGCQLENEVALIFLKYYVFLAIEEKNILLLVNMLDIFCLDKSKYARYFLSRQKYR